MNNNFNWHSEILPANYEDVLSELNRVISLHKFYLAGGTGLALILGHRISRDFDFFCTELFNEEMLVQQMQLLNELTIVSRNENTLHINLKGIKVSFLGYTYPLLFPAKDYKLKTGISVSIADERDIACMKISAISSRGTKRDFIDLYSIARQISLGKLLELFKTKYSLTPHNNVHVLKSLTYFDDAEAEPMPEMLVPIPWEKIKRFLLSEVPKLM